MSDHDQLYPQATRELAEQRARLAPEQGKAFRAFFQSVFTGGVLSATTKQLIAVAAAHVTQCPYCIRSHTRAAVQHGATSEHIMEAIWVVAEMRAGAAYARSVLALDTIVQIQAKKAVEGGFDTAYGRYARTVMVDGDDLVVDGRRLVTLRNDKPGDLPWKELGVELVFDCTGVFRQRQELEDHIHARARMVLLSAPSDRGDIETVVHGANGPASDATIISCANCTTNCIAPIAEIIGRRIGVAKAVMTTVHACTSSQSIVDGPSKHKRRGRAGAANLVPSATGAALATTRALPEYVGKFDGVAIRQVHPPHRIRVRLPAYRRGTRRAA